MEGRRDGTGGRKYKEGNGKERGDERDSLGG